MISIPSDGFQVHYTNTFKKKLKQTKKNFANDERFSSRLNDCIELIPSDLLNPKLKFHSLSNKAKNLGGNISYPYAVTIQGKYRIALYFDDGNTNPETKFPTSITFFYIGNYHD